MFQEMVIRGLVLRPARFCAPLAEVTHSAFRRLLADFGGCGAHFTEMLSGRKLVREDLQNSPYTKRNHNEPRLIYQLMLRADDPIDAIIGRLEEVRPDGIDLNLACYAPVIRQLDAGSRLFENLPALQQVLKNVRSCWGGPLTVKIRLGSATIGHEARFAERLRAIEDAGVDAVTLHTRFFEDKFKRRSRHELFKWATTQTKLPIIANGDILGPGTLSEQPEHFGTVAGIMIGRMAVACPWIFAAWDRAVDVDLGEVWQRHVRYICEDFPPHTAVRRIRLFTKYYARNFQFGHTFNSSIHNAESAQDMQDRAAAFFATNPARFDQPTLHGL